MERACMGINIIEAEDSKLKDIRFVAKMNNLSDLYIRKFVSNSGYNGALNSLNGIENCKNLKILFCNECKISNIK